MGSAGQGQKQFDLVQEWFGSMKQLTHYLSPLQQPQDSGEKPKNIKNALNFSFR
jgi:hypothetical protein